MGNCDVPVVVFVHQVVAGAEGDESGVVRWCWDRHGARTAHVCVAQLVGEKLQLICSEAVVVPQHVVVWGAAGALQQAKTELRTEGQMDIGRLKGRKTGSPGYQHDCTGRSQTLRDAWWCCLPWYLQEHYRSSQPAEGDKSFQVKTPMVWQNISDWILLKTKLGVAEQFRVTWKSLTRSALSEQKSRVWWRFCTTMYVIPGL